MHEVGHGLVCGEVLDLQESQYGASASSQKDGVVWCSRLEMGIYYDGFYHEATVDCVRGGFNLVHHGSIDQEWRSIFERWWHDMGFQFWWFPIRMLVSLPGSGRDSMRSWILVCFSTRLFISRMIGKVRRIFRPWRISFGHVCWISAVAGICTSHWLSFFTTKATMPVLITSF